MLSAFCRWQNARLARRLLLFPKISLRCDFREPCLLPEWRNLARCVSVDNIYNKEKRGRRLLFFAGRACAAKAEAGRRKGRRKEKRKAAYFFRAEGAGAEKRRKTGAKRGCFPREILPRILTNLLSCGILFLPKHSGGVENVRKDHRLHRPFSDAAASDAELQKGIAALRRRFCAAGPDAARTRWKSWANSFWRAKMPCARLPLRCRQSAPAPASPSSS